MTGPTPTDGSGTFDPAPPPSSHLGAPAGYGANAPRGIVPGEVRWSPAPGRGAYTVGSVFDADEQQIGAAVLGSDGRYRITSLLPSTAGDDGVVRDANAVVAEVQDRDSAEAWLRLLSDLHAGKYRKGN